MPLLKHRMCKSSFHLFGYLADECEYDRPELNITIDRLAYIATLSRKRTQMGMHDLCVQGIIVPYENRFHADQTRKPKGGAHKPVRYDVKPFHVGWDLAGLNGLTLWLAVCQLLKQQKDEAFDDFMGKMTFRRMQKIENGDYLIVVHNQFAAITERFNESAIVNKMSDIASDLSGAGVIIIAESDRRQAILELVEASDD